MKKVIDKVKTEYTKEKINNSFYQFSKDYHSRVHPCTARHSNTKAKVESPMKILGEWFAYSGDLIYDEFSLKLKEINEHENIAFHEKAIWYLRIPVLDLENEKDFLGKATTPFL